MSIATDERRITSHDVPFDIHDSSSVMRASGAVRTGGIGSHVILEHALNQLKRGADNADGSTTTSVVRTSIAATVPLIVFEMAPNESEEVVIGEDGAAIEATIVLEDTLDKNIDFSTSCNSGSTLWCMLGWHIAPLKGHPRDCHATSSDLEQGVIVLSINHTIPSAVNK
jgi:hypothetical protein